GLDREAQRIEPERGVLFRRGDDDFTGRGFAQLRVLPLFARRGRIGQLAGRDQSRFGMVSETRERLGGGALRQRLLDWRRNRSASGSLGLSHFRKLASGVHCDGRARLRLATAVPYVLSPSGRASAAVC